MHQIPQTGVLELAHVPSNPAATAVVATTIRMFKIAWDVGVKSGSYSSLVCIGGGLGALSLPRLSIFGRLKLRGRT